MKLGIFFLALLAFGAFGEHVAVLTDATFKDFLSSNPIVLLKLYAPWCGHCKKMAPEYEKAAESAKSANKPYVLAEIDCTKNPEASKHFGVTSYPTLKLVKNGAVSAYSGERKAENFIQFMDTAAGVPRVEFVIPANGLVDLGDSNYTEFLAVNKLVLVKVFAPWCGHCKKMAPEYERAALFAKEKSKPYVLAQIDGTVHRKAAAYFGVSGYPTIKAVKDGTTEEYEGDRSFDSLIKFMDEKAGIATETVESTSPIVELGDSNFTKYISDHKMVLIKIFAPWCGHCKKLAPEYEKAAEFAKQQGKPYILAQVDGTVHRKVMAHFNVTSYPTLKFIQDGNVIEYKEARTFEGLIQFLDKHAGLSSELPKEPAKEEPQTKVKTLTDATYQAFIKENSNEYILLKLYAPWCGHCKKMAPEFERAASIALEQKKPYIFAEIDATENSEASSHFEVQGYPTVKFLHKEQVEDYNEERTAEDFINYLNKKAGVNMIHLQTVNDVKKVLAMKTFRSILVSDNAEVLKEYKEAAAEMVEYSYYYTSFEVGKKAFPKIEKDPVVVIINSYGEEEKYYVPTFNKYELEDFITSNENPTVITHFTQPIINSVFFNGASKVGVFMFRSVMDSNADQIDIAFRKAAEKFKGNKYVIGLTDIKTEGYPQKVAFYLGLTEKDLPSLEIINSETEMKRYVYKGPMTEEGIYDFVKKYEQGKATRFFRSEPVPEENNGPVYKVVGKTFDKEVLKDKKDVVVKFCAPWEKKCAEFEKTFNELATKLQGNKKMKFVAVDVSKNDIKGHTIKSLPTVKVFPGKNKKDAVKYEGELNEKNLLDFLKQKSSFPIEETA